MNAARAVLEVTAGVVPRQAMAEHTRRWMLTSDEWDRAGELQAEMLAERNGQAQGYAALLMLQPQRLNWVRLEWIWL